MCCDKNRSLFVGSASFVCEKCVAIYFEHLIDNWLYESFAIAAEEEVVGELLYT